MRKSIMSRSSSETQSLRRSAQPTRPCAEAHALPHAQRSSVSYALSPPRSHGTAPKPTGPLRRAPSLNLARPRSGSSRRSHAQRSAMASDPPDAAPRARRRPSRTAFGGVASRAHHSRSLLDRATCPVSAVPRPETATGPRRPMRPPSRPAACVRRAPCASCAADTVSGAGAQAVATCGAACPSQRVVSGACTRQAP